VCWIVHIDRTAGLGQPTCTACWSSMGSSWMSWSPAKARSYSPTTIASNRRPDQRSRPAGSRLEGVEARAVGGNSRRRSTRPRSPHDRRPDPPQPRTATLATTPDPKSRRSRCGRRTRTATHPMLVLGVRPSGNGPAAAAVTNPPARHSVRSDCPSSSCPPRFRLLPTRHPQSPAHDVPRAGTTGTGDRHHDPGNGRQEPARPKASQGPVPHLDVARALPREGRRVSRTVCSGR
jgi:hypothetical protein